MPRSPSIGSSQPLNRNGSNHNDSNCNEMEVGINSRRTQERVFILDRLTIQANQKGCKKTWSSIVEDISIDCASGETLGILGASGSGKSTLLSFISGRLLASRNYTSKAQTLKFKGKEIKPAELGRLSYFVPCYSELLPYLNAKQSVTFEEGLRGGANRGSLELEAVLESVGLPAHCIRQSVNGYLTSPLSEAELRKLGLAMAVTANAEIVLFDEPTSFVSEAHGVDILKFITSTAKDRKNVSIITLHQPTMQQLLLLDRVMILDTNGRCIHQGSPQETLRQLRDVRVSSSLTDHQYLCALLSNALDELDYSDSDSSAQLEEDLEVSTRLPHKQSIAGSGYSSPVSTTTPTTAVDRRKRLYEAWISSQVSVAPMKISNPCPSTDMMSVMRTNEKDENTTRSTPRKSVGSKKILTLLKRTFFFRLQNPIAFCSVLSVMVAMSLLFGAVFYGVGSILDDTMINDIIEIPEIDLPSLSPEISHWLSTWTASIDAGFGPYARHPFEEGFPTTESTSIHLSNGHITKIPSGVPVPVSIQSGLDSVMNVTFCSSLYWRIVSRWYSTYREVLPNVYHDMMVYNDPAIDGLVVPKVPLSSRYESPFDRMAMTLHDLTLDADYILKRSGLLDTIARCKTKHPDDTRFWTCSRSILKEFDGLLVCAGLPGFQVQDDMHSPWEVPDDNLGINEVQEDKEELSYRSHSKASNESDRGTLRKQSESEDGFEAKAPTADKGRDGSLSPVQKLLIPISGGISLGAGIVFILAVVAFGMFPIIVNYWMERESANRDTIARSYSVISFFVAKTAGDFIFDMVPVLILSLIFCGLIGLDGWEFVAVQLMVIGLAWAHGGYTYLFTALCRQKSMAMACFSCWTFISLLFSGFMLRVSDMPSWCAWWRFLSALYWTYGGSVCQFFKPRDGLALSNVILTALGVTDDAQTNIYVCCLALFLMGLGVRIAACIAQWTLHRDIGTQSDYYSL